MQTNFSKRQLVNITTHGRGLPAAQQHQDYSTLHFCNKVQMRLPEQTGGATRAFISADPAARTGGNPIMWVVSDATTPPAPQRLNSDTPTTYRITSRCAAITSLRHATYISHHAGCRAEVVVCHHTLQDTWERTHPVHIASDFK